jgi:pyruvate dehydrogenase E2 component (dihydrolipoyllysine-residue acetyltransferase)
VARVDVVMPQMGESIAEGTLSKWLKKVGDQVKRDEPIFEISTDKVDAEIPAPTSGVLAEIVVTEGQTVAVQTVVARLETDVNAPVAAPAVAAPAPAAAATPAIPAAAAAAASPPAAAPPVPAAHGNGSSLEDRLRTKSSPLVRRMAAEHGVEISALSGSGIAGRVTKKDLIGFLESGAKAPPPRGAAPAAVGHGPLPEPWAGDRVEPMSKMRALIAEHMVTSKHTSAHVSSIFEVDFSRVVRIRSTHRAEFERATGEKLTFMPFIIKAVVDGLKAHPVLNAAVRGNEIIYRKAINLGIAVALDWGLIVPVIRNADNLSLTGLTRSLNDLAGRARTKRLDPREIQDGTFTITNPGVFGSMIGTPIINQPQVGILCVGGLEKRVKVVAGDDGGDTIAIRTCAYLSLSFDHRIVDGSDADKFMALVKKSLENFPETVL